MKIKLLGTGSPRPSLKRAGSSYLVEVGNDILLFDHGPGSHHRLLEAGYTAGDIPTLIFSHFHYDHCIDYARLVMTRWDHFGHAVDELNVYGPPPTAQITERLFGEGGAFWPDITVRTNHESSKELFVERGGTLPRKAPAPVVTEWLGGEELKGDGWTLRAIEVPHGQPWLHCLGFRIDSDEGSVVYAGDCGASDALISFAKGADVLIHMTYQISGTALNEEWRQASAGHQEVAEIAERAGVKTLVASHISTDQMDVPGVREVLIADMVGRFSGTLYWAEDLMEIPLAGPHNLGVGETL
jgi:ribonuclease Z